MFRFLAVLFAALALSPCLSAAEVDPGRYGFPLENPFEATIATTPPELRPPLPADSEIDQQDFSLPPQTQRRPGLPGNFWPVQELRYRLARQDGIAPLIFIISGTGAHYASGKTEYLKKLFYGAGYHVVQLSSPTSYDFMASASHTATPGIGQEDAQDLYRVMQAIRAQQADLPVSEFHLIGYSLGAFNAAFVSRLDERLKSFDFKRVLLLNPPVNLRTSVRALDRLVQTDVAGVTSNLTFYELIFGKLTRYFQQQGYINLDDALLYEFQQSRQRLSNEEMAMLIGSVFRFAVADIAFTSDLLNQRGLITPPGYPMDETTQLAPFYKRALQCNFACYLEEQLTPMWRSRNGAGSLQQLVRQISLYEVEDYLRESDKIAVMHNADDFILGSGDLGFLRRTFGERLTLYPFGGHCGNLNYRINSAAMLEFFRG